MPCTATRGHVTACRPPGTAEVAGMTLRWGTAAAVMGWMAQQEMVRHCGMERGRALQVAWWAAE